MVAVAFLIGLSTPNRTLCRTISARCRCNRLILSAADSGAHQQTLRCGSLNYDIFCMPVAD